MVEGSEVRLIGLIVAGAVGLAAGAANATAVTYDITGKGTGDLNGTGFSGAAFDIHLIGDSGNESSGGGIFSINPLDSMTVSIAGFSPVTLSIGTRIGLNTSNSVVFIGRTGTGNDLFDFFLTSTPGDFFAPFGPIKANGDPFALNEFQFVHTSGGDLSFDSATKVSISADGGVVPEPATWATMLIGLGALGAVLRRRRRGEALAG